MLGAASWLCFLGFDEYLCYFRPKDPDQSKQQTEQHSAGFEKYHVYITPREFVAFYVLLWMSPTLLLTAYGLNQRWKIFAKAPARFRPFTPD